MPAPAADTARLGPMGLTLDVLAAASDSAEGLAKRQRRRLGALLQSAAVSVPRFRDLLRGRDPLNTPLADLPPSGKAELMQHFEAGLADPALSLDQVRRFCADATRVGQRCEGRYWVWESSGSTGQPGVYLQDEAAMAVYDTLEALRRPALRPLARLFDPFCFGERFALVGAVGGHFASSVGLQRLCTSMPWLRHWRNFSILQPADALAAQLDDFGPTLLATYPTAALMLAEEAAAARLRCRPREIWTGGETLTEAMRTRIESVFGPVLQDSYGASEFLPIAYECRHHRLHVNADWVILEPVDATGRPTPAGCPSHTALLTNLANHLQPLVRFDIGDSIVLGQAPCACGSALPTLQVQGRSDDVLVLTGRQGRPVHLLPLALTQVLEEQAGVFDYQLRQTGAATLHLALGPLARRDAGAAARCRALLGQLAAQHGVAGLTLRMGSLGAPQRGHSGKVKRIVALGR